MPALDYRLATLATGSNPDDWSTLDELIGFMNIPVGITSDYIAVPEVIKVADASRVGRGMPYFTWSIKGLRPFQRSALRTFCPDVSATVYARTLTNELDVYLEPTWIDVKAVMVWPAPHEDNRLIGFADFQLHFDVIEELS